MWKDRGDIMAYTINANAKNVWIRDNEDTRDLSIQTDASSVYLDNGRTLEQELGEGSMVSNVTTVDSAMSKVIDGTLDGAYESGVMYGKSLVNLVSNHKIKIANGATNSFPMVIPMDAKKKYLISFKIDTAHTSAGEPNQSAIKLQYYAHDNNKGYNFIYNSELADGREFKFIVEPFSGEVNQNTNFFAIWLTRYESGTLRGKLSVFEYVDGMENWETPYFDGLCDVKMPILRNVGKNLLDPQTFIPLDKGVEYVRYEDGYVLANFTNANTHFFYKVDLARLPKGMYTVIAKHEGEKSYLGIQHTFKDGTKTWGKTQFNNDGSYAELGLYMQSTTNDPSLKVKAKIMLVANGDTTSPYEDYKTNILRTPETVTLRSLPNGVRDELNLKTGEYIKRIGEVVLNGTENNWMTIFDFNVADDYSTFKLDTALPNGETFTYPLDAYIVDKMQNGRSLNELREFVHINSQPRVCIKLLQTRLSEQTVTGLKAWLQSNPITVQYELAEPITTKVTLTQSEPIVKIGTELPNGVCDTYNLLTGEHIQRVGKVVLDGSEDYELGARTRTETTYVKTIVDNTTLDVNIKEATNIVCDRLKPEIPEVLYHSEYEGVCLAQYHYIDICLLNSHLASADISGAKQWLKENPTTIYYELANPIVTKKNGLPNTHGISLPNGVVDKYNESTGVYTQNVGKIVLDGSESWSYSESSTGQINYFIITHQIASSNDGTVNVLTGDFPTYANDHLPHPNGVNNGICGRPNGSGFNIVFEDSTINTVDKAREFVKTNPITVYYPLATPKTIDIPLINVGQVLPNGVCDTYNPITKEYVKRLGSIVLNGDENWNLDSSAQPNTIRFRFPLNKRKVGIDNVFGDRFKVHNTYDLDEESVFGSQTSTYFYIRIARSRLATQDLSGFKAWLKANPLTVWYELEAPQTTTVDLDLSTLYSSNPIAYENGHIILESGHDGQSLLPTLEYSTVTNRVKQIENIGEQVLRQEKQLTMLEQMLIQNIIGLDYNNTVLALNLEINEVM